MLQASRGRREGQARASLAEVVPALASCTGRWHAPHEPGHVLVVGRGVGVSDEIPVEGHFSAQSEALEYLK